MLNKTLTSNKLIYLKVVLFSLIFLISVTEILLETKNLKIGILLILITWSSARIYYFMFYVIENYIDTDYKFSGMIALIQYLLKK